MRTAAVKPPSAAVSPAFAKCAQGAEPYREQLHISEGDVGPLTNSGRRRPERAGGTAPTTRFKRPLQYHDILVRWVRVDGDRRARGELGKMDRAVRNGLRQRLKIDARQNVDRKPAAVSPINERLFSGHRVLIPPT